MFELEEMLDFGSRYMNRRRIFGSLSKSKDSGTGETWGKKIDSKLPFALRIHSFFRGDKDKWPHNHPWKWAISFIFWGGYQEYRISKKTGKAFLVDRFAPAINILTDDDYHIVTKIYGKPYTLFFCGPRVQEWGFLVDGIHFDWRTYLGFEEKESAAVRPSSKTEAGNSRYH